jgi:hypothetical protein
LTIPVILVQATLHQNLSDTPQPEYGIMSYIRNGSWDSSTAQAGYPTCILPGGSTDCAVRLSAEVDLVGGGADGLRGVDQVFGGWAQNLISPAGISGVYQNNHLDTEVFASNVPPPPHNPAIFYPAGQYSKKGDPNPQIINGALLDSINPAPGVGGNSSLLSNSKYQDATTAPLWGKRKLITAFDDTRQGFLALHPIDMASRLTQIQYNLPFSSFLTLWTSVGGIRDPNDTTGTPLPGAPGALIADRTYGVILAQPWNIHSTFSVDASGNGTIAPGVLFVYLGAPSCSPPGCAVLPLAGTGAVLTAPIQCMGAGPASPCTVQNAQGSNYEH